MCSSMVILRVPFPVLNTWVLGLVFAMTPEEMEDESILIPLGGPGFHPSIGLGEVRKRYVTDADLIPTWSDDDDWLPLDWRIGFKQKPLSVHKIYIPPGLRTKWAHGGWISFFVWRSFVGVIHLNFDHHVVRAAGPNIRCDLCHGCFCRTGWRFLLSEARCVAGWKKSKLLSLHPHYFFLWIIDKFNHKKPTNRSRGNRTPRKFEISPPEIHFTPLGASSQCIWSRLEYLRTGKKLVRFGVSKPLAVRKAIAAAAKKRKRSRGSRGSSRGSEETAHFPKRFASAADYEEVKYFQNVQKRWELLKFCFWLLG